MLRAKVQICAMLAAGGVLSGCVASLDRRPVQTSIGSGGSTWEAVLPSPGTVQALGSFDARQYAEFSRNDAKLSPRPVQARLATNQWPEAPRASLSRARRLYLETRPDQVLYFESTRDELYERDRSSGWNWWW